MRHLKSQEKHENQNNQNTKLQPKKTKKTKNKDRPSFEQKEEAGGRRVCVSEREREHY